MTGLLEYDHYSMYHHDRLQFDYSPLPRMDMYSPMHEEPCTQCCHITARSAPHSMYHLDRRFLPYDYSSLPRMDMYSPVHEGPSYAQFCHSTAHDSGSAASWVPDITTHFTLPNSNQHNSLQ